ncbi:ly6/PLAUR domain-containing protein 6 [Trichomycterus rosablanca]|uniref:ly6/PLAUR domain-containing protein 6 n=1 Tax=Trichomycterus rosablanca TaxID=2290929 RepID=UPI002F35664B
MEPWPVVAWVLMLTSIADWMKTVQSRDFTEKDIIFLHPSTTPYPGGFKCFTCEEAADNYECNRWAPDFYCPQETKYCYTSHTLDWIGNTLAVMKRCAALEDCLSTGCNNMNNEGNKVCISCCEGNICNMPLPQNETDAIFTTTSPLNSSHQPAEDYKLLFLLFMQVLILSRA